MKRLLNILVLLGMSWQLALAQDQDPEQSPDQVREQPTFVTNVSYIYRNDDHFHGFADDEVDSIKFSRIDADGIEHVDYVTQVVYTPDSIYRIPLAAIDSVVCEQPKMELQKDVVMLTEEQRSFVVRADSTTILFRNDTPRDLIPERGEVLLAFNYGNQSALQFTGRVERVERTAEGVLVTCDPDVQIGDIFRRFTAVMFTSPTMDDSGGDQEWDVPHSGNREKTFDPFSKDFSWEPKQIPYIDPKTGEPGKDEKGNPIIYTDKYISGCKKSKEIKENLLDLIKDKPAWMNEGVELNVGLTFNFKYRQKVVVDFFKDEDDWIIPSLYLYFRPTMLPSIDGWAQLKIEKQWSKDISLPFKIPAIGIWIPPTPVSPPIRIGEVNIHVEEFYVEFGAETDIKYTFSIDKIFDVELEYNSSGAHVTDMTKNGGYKDKSGVHNNGFSFGDSDLGDDVDHLGSAYVWLAWKPSVGLSLINERVLTANLGAKFGPWIQLNFEKAKTTTDENARFYQTWSPSHLLTKMKLKTDLKLIFLKGTKWQEDFSLADKLKDWGVTDGEGWDFFVKRYGIFPAFGMPTLTNNWEKSLNQRGVISLTTPYKNPNHGTPVKYDDLTSTFLSADLGTGIYKVNSDGTQTEVARSFKPGTEKDWFSSKEGDYTTEFNIKDVKRGVYKAAPLFDAAFFSPLRATPEAEIIIPPTAVTEEATEVGKHHCFMNGYTLGLKTFSELMEGEAKLGWIIKKVKEGDNSNSLTVMTAEQTGTFDVADAVSETVNGEDKLNFGKAHSQTSRMVAMSRCDKLTPSTTYVYRTWASYPNGHETKIIYGDPLELTTDVDDDLPRCETDLGLSVNWACYNVGAAYEYKYGDYYAWGELSTKKDYTAATYKLPSKQNISGDTDYDVATKWNNKKNSGWRMPTKAEFQELIDNCDMEWVTVHKVEGMKFTSKINGNSIFLPAAGNRYGKKTYSNGIGGCYWTGDLDPESLLEEQQNAVIGEIEEEHEDEPDLGEGDAKKLTSEEKADAWRLHFNNVEEEGKEPHNEAGRCYYGRSIRPVKQKIELD